MALREPALHQKGIPELSRLLIVNKLGFIDYGAWRAGEQGVSHKYFLPV
jgi:hypothetical protein